MSKFIRGTFKLQDNVIDIKKFDSVHEAFFFRTDLMGGQA